jgi:hypothetical protein
MAELTVNLIFIKLKAGSFEYGLNGNYKLITDEDKMFGFKGNLDDYIEKISNKYPDMTSLVIRTNSDLDLHHRIKNYNYKVETEKEGEYLTSIIVDFKNKLPKKRTRTVH